MMEAQTGLPNKKEPTKIVQKRFPTLSEDGHPSSVDNLALILPGLENAYVENLSDVNLNYFKTNRRAFRALNLTKRYLKTHNSELLQHISDLDLITNLLGVDSPSKALEALSDEKNRDQLRGAVNAEIANIYQFKEGAKATKIAEFGKTADKFIVSYLRLELLEPFAGRIDMAEEVKGTNDIVGLLNLMVDPKNSKRVRFEAKRKLILMQLVAQLDKSERDDKELNLKMESRRKKVGEQNTDPFISFLDDNNVWSQENGRGSTTDTILLSKHTLDNYACTSVEEISNEDEMRKRLAHHNPQKAKYHYRITHIPQRIFEFKGEQSPAAFEPRPAKEFVSSVGKLFRKGELDPSVGVEDKKAWMFIVRNRRDAIRLKRTLEAAGRKSKDGMVKVLKTEDSTQGEKYSAQHPGSSHLLEGVKVDFMVKGAKIETLIFTYEEYLNYKHMDELAHEDYEINRLVKSGAFEALFPESIYGISENDLKRLIEYQQRGRRDSNFF